MGYGDDLIVSAIVRKAYAKHGKPICVGDGRDIRLDDVFDGKGIGQVFQNNPKLATAIYPGAVWVRNVMGERPYIDYMRTTPEKVVYNSNFRVEPGEIFLTDEERARYAHYGGFIYIEPNTKGTFGGNKDWGFDRWQQVVKRLPYRFVQGKGRKLDGVEQCDTRTFRDACILLERADFFVGTDGGLHHAAAAMGKRAVVVWGGLVPPRILGYDAHINLHSGVASCGSAKPCQHCRKALDWVTVDMVVEAITKLHEELHVRATGHDRVVA